MDKWNELYATMDFNTLKHSDTVTYKKGFDKAPKDDTGRIAAAKEGRKIQKTIEELEKQNNILEISLSYYLIIL